MIAKALTPPIESELCSEVVNSFEKEGYDLLKCVLYKMYSGTQVLHHRNAE